MNQITIKLDAKADDFGMADSDCNDAQVTYLGELAGMNDLICQCDRLPGSPMPQV